MTIDFDLDLTLICLIAETPHTSNSSGSGVLPGHDTINLAHLRRAGRWFLRGKLEVSSDLSETIAYYAARCGSAVSDENVEALPSSVLSSISIFYFSIFQL